MPRRQEKAQTSPMAKKKNKKIKKKIRKVISIITN
jgi:hypothetical protein